MRRSRDNSYQEAIDKLHLLIDGPDEQSCDEGASLTEGRLSHEDMASGEVNSNEKLRESSHFRRSSLQKLPGPKAFRRHRSRRLRPSMMYSGRHNSWHNLIKPHSDEEERTHSRSESNRYEDVLCLAKKQEEYIKQLEEEGKFCRDKLNKILHITKDLLEEKEQSIEPVVQGLLQEIDPVDSPLPFKLENIALKKQIAAITDSEKLKEQALRKEIGVLSESLNHIRSELEEVSRRESEAVEQVKRSVEVAEQVRLEKTDLEFEIGQLKIQVERQQNRIRTLIEEQVIKSEEERAMAEKKYQSQLLQLKDQFQNQAGDTSRILSENEKLKNTLMELKNNLEDRDKLISELRVDNDKRIADLQLEIVSSETRRQQSEQELAMMRLDFDGLKHDLKSEKSRAESEIRSFKQRMERTDEMLTQSREENLRNVEKNATLERELRLVKLSHEQGTKDSSSNVLLESYVKECDSERRTHRMIVERLEDLVRRQSRIIGELKNQSAELVDKLELVSKDKHSVSTERDDLRARLAFLEKSKSESDVEIQTLRTEMKSLQSEIRRQETEIKEMNAERMHFLKNERFIKEDEVNVRKNERRLRYSPALNSSAITILRKEQISSPKKVSNTF